MVKLTIEQLTRIYNIGYNSGHEHTVEGTVIPVHLEDMDEDNRDVVLEILEDVNET